MTSLSLKEAAERMGIPSTVLHGWTWGNVGPKPEGYPNHSIWRPTYEAKAIDAWLAEYAAPVSKSVH